MSTLQQNESVSASYLEHQILEHIKDALRVTIDWQAPSVSMPRKLDSVRFTFLSFQRHLERTLTTEEENGYLTDVIESKPTMQTKVDRLEKDHAIIREHLGLVLPALNDLNKWNQSNFEVVCQDIRSLLEEVDQHDRQEIELLQESLLWDEGGEG